MDGLRVAASGGRAGRMSESSPNPSPPETAEGRGGRRRAMGCLIAFLGMLVLTLTPAVGRWIDIPPPVATAILIGSLLLLVLGAAFGIMGSSVDDPGTPQD